MPQIFTYQTRIGPSAELDTYAELYGRVERALFADAMRGRNLSKLKNEYLRRFEIPARLFNAARIAVEGKIQGNQKNQQVRQQQLKEQIARANRVITALEKKPAQETPLQQRKRHHKLHQKKRRLFNLEQKLQKLVRDMDAGLVHIAFGSRKLWQAQFNLAANGYATHEDWLADWRKARSDELFLLGSADESGGCQLCVATLNDNGIELRVRLPDALLDSGSNKYIVFSGLDFNHGQAAILAALDNNGQYRIIKNRLGDQSARASGYGQALSYRFVRDAQGWRVLVSTEVERAPIVTDKRAGVIGVDVNADHLAVAETDRFGNPLKSWSVPLVTYGKSKNQADALIGEAIASIVDYAVQVGKPISIEKLDFSQKKAQLEAQGVRYCRMLSAFSYEKIKARFISHAFRTGVIVYQVNPAYSSVIGRVKYAQRYGLTVHQAAALVLAQRILGVGERLPRHRFAPDGKNGRVTFTVPARKRCKHVWSLWAGVAKSLKAALVAQYRQARASPPVASAAVVTRSVGNGEIPFGESLPTLFG